MNKKLVGISFVVLILLCMALMLATLYKKSIPRVTHCSPWRNVIGYEALCNELNMVMNCSIDPCTGQSQNKSFPHMTYADDQELMISANQRLNPEQQHDVMQRAMKLAYQHLPAGYFISETSLTPTAKKQDSISYLDLKVTYKICGPAPVQ